ncbi:MAG: hypothetical protein ACRDNS_21330, partial [Trebonia sp.]
MPALEADPALVDVTALDAAEPPEPEAEPDVEPELEPQPATPIARARTQSSAGTRGVSRVRIVARNGSWPDLRAVDKFPGVSEEHPSVDLAMTTAQDLPGMAVREN